MSNNANVSIIRSRVFGVTPRIQNCFKNVFEHCSRDVVAKL